MCQNHTHQWFLVYNFFLIHLDLYCGIWLLYIQDVKTLHSLSHSSSSVNSSVVRCCGVLRWALSRSELISPLVDVVSMSQTQRGYVEFDGGDVRNKFEGDWWEECRDMGKKVLCVVIAVKGMPFWEVPDHKIKEKVGSIFCENHCISFFSEQQIFGLI